MFKKSIAALMAVSLCFAGMAAPVSSNLSTVTPICASAAYENGVAPKHQQYHAYVGDHYIHAERA